MSCGTGIKSGCDPLYDVDRDGSGGFTELVAAKLGSSVKLPSLIVVFGEVVMLLPLLTT